MTISTLLSLAVMGGLLVFAAWAMGWLPSFFTDSAAHTRTPQAAPAQENQAGTTDAHKKGYVHMHFPVPHDGQANRSVGDRLWRWLVLLISAGTAVIVPISFFSWLGSQFHSFFGHIGLLIGILASAWLLMKMVDRFLIYNREWSAYVTQDALKGTMVSYGPGLHPSLPWEERNALGNQSLEVITVDFVVKVQTKTALVEAKGSLQYAADLSNIASFIGADESTIEKGYIGFLEGFLAREISSGTADEALLGIESLNKKLGAEFQGEKGVTGRTPLEDNFGIQTVSIILTGMSLSAAAQKTRDAIDEAKTLHTIVATMLGITPATLTRKLKKGDIDQEQYNQLLNRAMATSDNATMDYKVHEVNVPPAVIKALGSVFGTKANDSGASPAQKPDQK